MPQGHTITRYVYLTKSRHLSSVNSSDSLTLFRYLEALAPRRASPEAPRDFRGYVYIPQFIIQLDLFCLAITILTCALCFLGHGETSWCFSQVKGALNDDITDADVISCVEFNHDGDLLATGDKGGRVVIFQVSWMTHVMWLSGLMQCFVERSQLENIESSSRWVQRLQHLPISRAWIRLPEVTRDRGENQQNSMA